MAAKKGKLTRAERAEISRRNLRKAFQARGVKATFEPASEPKRRRRRATRVMYEPAPAFVFEPARKKTTKKTTAKKTTKRAAAPTAGKIETMRALGREMLKTGQPIPGHILPYMTDADYALAKAEIGKKTPLTGTAKRKGGRPRLPTAQLKHPRRGKKSSAKAKKAGRPRLPTAQLKHPRRAKKATGAAPTRRGRPRMPTAQLKHPRAKPRQSTLPALRGIGRGMGKGIIRSGRYGNPETGEVISIRRVYSKKNPIWETKHLAAAGGGLIVGIVGADLLDRFLATMAPEGSTEALTDVKAIAAIRSKTNAVRMASSAGGAVVGFGGAYLLRNKSPMASYALGGFGLGFGVKFLTQLVTDVLMPIVFKVEDRTADKTANRLYPDKQGYADVSTTPSTTKTSTPTTTAGVGAPRVYRLPAPSRAMNAKRAMPDFGPVARRPGSVGGCNCGGSGSCSSTSCSYPFERFNGSPNAGMSPIPQSILQSVPQPVPPVVVPDNQQQNFVQPSTNVDVDVTGQVFATETPQISPVLMNAGVATKADVIDLLNRRMGMTAGSRRRH
jgi:hypothetical protein